mmetsp:Transcript_9652/g.12150  ORF Transcript_9652/g.12150 Transcript_9652/m.12150 type:complete len:238 (-) Transcript_9652:339-1052(-)
MTSTPASTRAAARSLSSGRVPIAAPTRSCLLLSLDAFGKSLFFCKSVRAMRATSSSESLTTGSLPFFEALSISFACSNLTPSDATESCARGVMNSLILILRSSTKDVSRFEIIPTSLDPILPSCVIGMPEYPNLDLMSSASWRVSCGLRQTGSVMNPFLNFLTLRTSDACVLSGRLEWMIPIPPMSAMWMAILASVTVSMGDETKGVLSLIFLVRLDEMSTSFNPKDMWPGIMIRSS